MAVRDIVFYPNKVLTTPAAKVEKEEFNDDLQTLIDDMIETMYAAKGIGLAAPQIGISKRITVIDTARENEPPDVRVLINPEIIETSDEIMSWEEGCLSFPDVYDEVERPKACKVRALNRHGEEVIHEGEGLLAICMQHEIDHLDGIVFVDHLSRLKRRMALKKNKKNVDIIEAERKKAKEKEAEEQQENAIEEQTV